MGINLPRGEACVNVLDGSARWKQIADKIPMPGFLAHACARILERLVLKASGGEANGAAKLKQALSIGGDQVGHRATFPRVAVQP